eukprot:1525397-Pleurochrysis_carterae.AAC.2
MHTVAPGYRLQLKRQRYAVTYAGTPACTFATIRRRFNGMWLVVVRIRTPPPRTLMIMIVQYPTAEGDCWVYVPMKYSEKRALQMMSCRRCPAARRAPAPLGPKTALAA